MNFDQLLRDTFTAYTETPAIVVPFLAVGAINLLAPLLSRPAFLGAFSLVNWITLLLATATVMDASILLEKEAPVSIGRSWHRIAGRLKHIVGADVLRYAVIFFLPLLMLLVIGFLVFLSVPEILFQPQALLQNMGLTALVLGVPLALFLLLLIRLMFTLEEVVIGRKSAWNAIAGSYTLLWKHPRAILTFVALYAGVALAILFLVLFLSAPFAALGRTAVAVAGTLFGVLALPFLILLKALFYIRLTQH